MKSSSDLNLFGKLGYKVITIIDESCRVLMGNTEKGHGEVTDIELNPTLKSGVFMSKMESKRKVVSSKEAKPDINFAGEEIYNYGGQKTRKSKKSNKIKNRKTNKIRIE